MCRNHVHNSQNNHDTCVNETDEGIISLLFWCLGFTRIDVANMPSYKHRSLHEYGVINHVLLGLRYQHLLFYSSIRHYLTPPYLRIFFRSLPFPSLSLSPRHRPHHSSSRHNSAPLLCPLPMLLHPVIHWVWVDLHTNICHKRKLLTPY